MAVRRPSEAHRAKMGLRPWVRVPYHIPVLVVFGPNCEPRSFRAFVPSLPTHVNRFDPPTSRPFSPLYFFHRCIFPLGLVVGDSRGRCIVLDCRSRGRFRRSREARFSPRSRTHESFGSRRHGVQKSQGRFRRRWRILERGWRWPEERCGGIRSRRRSEIRQCLRLKLPSIPWDDTFWRRRRGRNRWRWRFGSLLEFKLSLRFSLLFESEPFERSLLEFFIECYPLCGTSPSGDSTSKRSRYERIGRCQFESLR